MVQRGQNHVVTDQGTVSDKNSALVLKFAAHVDKDPFPDMDVLPAVGVEGREQSKALVHRLTDELGKQGPQLLRLMVASVDFGCNPQGLLADTMHEQVGLTAAGNRFSAVQMFQICF